MRKEEYLKTVEKQIQFIFDRNIICKELEEHLIDSIEDLMEEGLSKEEAEKIAVEQMGDPVEVGKQLNKEHHPWIGYLLVLSRFVLSFIIFYLLMVVIINVSDVYNLITPAIVEESVEVYPIQYKVDGIAHDVIIDSICVDENGQYRLTYRSIRDFKYNRSPNYKFNIKIQEENFWVAPGRSVNFHSFGCYGYIDFKYPNNHILSIWIEEEDVYINLDLREYMS